MTLIPLHYRHIWDTVISPAANCNNFHTKNEGVPVNRTQNRPDLTDFWILYLPNLIRVYPLCVHLVCTLRATLDLE
jgi:hypothetical protein